MSRNACECRTRRRSARSRRHRAQLRRAPRRVRATPLISMTLGGRASSKAVDACVAEGSSPQPAPFDKDARSR